MCRVISRGFVFSSFFFGLLGSTDRVSSVSRPSLVLALVIIANYHRSHLRCMNNKRLAVMTKISIFIIYRTRRLCTAYKVNLATTSSVLIYQDHFSRLISFPSTFHVQFTLQPLMDFFFFHLVVSVMPSSWFTFIIITSLIRVLIACQCFFSFHVSFSSHLCFS